MLPKTVTLALVLVAVAGTACSDVDFAGTYTIPTPNGDMVLTLMSAADGTIGGSLTIPGAGETCRVAGGVTVDEDDERSVEGEIVCANGRSEFELAEDEDGEFMLLLIPYDASNTPRADLAAIYYGRRGAPVDASKQDALDEESLTTPPVSVQRDPRLIGTWATQVVMSTSAGSVATQLLMEIRSDGTLVDMGSRSLGGIPGVSGDTGLQGGGDVASWQTRDNVLHVSYAGSAWVPLASYEISGDRVLFVYYDGDRKLWHRHSS